MQRAIACNGLRHLWRLWRGERPRICKLQRRLGAQGFESHPHRQKTKDLTDSGQVLNLGSNSFRANAVQMANGLIGNPCGRERGRAGRAQFRTHKYG